MKRIISQLKAKKDYFDALAKNARARLSRMPDEGRLRIRRTRGYTQFFHVTRKGEHNGHYLSQKNGADLNLTRRLAQKEYTEELIRIAEQYSRAISFFLDQLPETEVKNIKVGQPVFRTLVSPPSESEMTDDEFITAWRAVTYKGKEISDECARYTTNRGETVRSKSEKIIADLLDSRGIPYRYEFPQKMKVGRIRTAVFYPDFTILAPDRREVILEHFGLMDDPEYCRNALKKFSIYVSNGIFPGDRFLFTYETSEMPFDSRLLGKMLDKMFGAN
ncbi:MAG: hypothetical protein MJ184_10960 [Treponema sp.]|uniref:hypothetical protein n=1 Tax=Treponema sp. TaxID=166 RepID=UPI00298DDD0F|nr:hypothetical protein [Treponema sp.]MCQ2601867.1 hypothetical protein [Treponema sp.]